LRAQDWSCPYYGGLNARFLTLFEGATTSLRLVHA